MTPTATATATTQPDAARVTLICPHCGSADLLIYSTERRVCHVTTRAEALDDPAAGADPWPSYQADAFVDIDPVTFAGACDACHAHHIMPCGKEQPMPWAVVKPHSAWLAHAKDAWPSWSRTPLCDLAAINRHHVARLIEALCVLMPGHVSQERQDRTALRPVGEVWALPDQDDADVLGLRGEASDGQC